MPGVVSSVLHNYILYVRRMEDAARKRVREWETEEGANNDDDDVRFVSCTRRGGRRDGLKYVSMSHSGRDGSRMRKDILSNAIREAVRDGRGSWCWRDVGSGR